MNDKLDIFEILGVEHKNTQTEDQEQSFVSDPDFNEAIKELSFRYTETEAEDGTDDIYFDMTELNDAATGDATVTDSAEPEPNGEEHSRQDKTVSSKSKHKKAKKNKKSKKDSTKKSNSVKSKRIVLIKWLPVIATLMLFFTFVINMPKVVGSSMEPCLYNGDRAVINKLARNYKTGDVIVFEAPSGERLVKRIVAIEGDVINITPENEFYKNGEQIEEDYIYTETGITDISVFYPVIVSEDSYFVMGDNRTNSKDSRNSDIGLVKKENIIGKVIFCLRKI